MKAIKYFLIIAIMFVGSAYTNQTNQFAKLRNNSNQAFTYGEELKYRVHYGWINAASIRIKIADKPVKIKGRSTYNITAYGRTFRSFDWAYKVRDHFETYLDSQSIAPLKYYKNVQEDNYKDEDLVYYDHEKKWMTGTKKSMTIPAYLQDLVSGMFYARTLDLQNAQVGETFPLDIYLDQEIYNLKFKYMGKETLRTDVGKVKCIKLIPQLVVDRVFKDEDDMTVWVSDDANKIPVRVKAEIYVGSVKVDLTSYKGLKNNFSSKL
ncbi:MAG: DUF3108 domain-containing protein [Bacteroidia bacterium]|nr:DUF3108 domain-containing protein [Bacteroidia bacterium]NNJ55696.1 DUF3108 domain-containing protein [Bacteroidia bacterium]